LPSTSTAAKTTANAWCPYIISHLSCWEFAALLLLLLLLLLLELLRPLLATRQTTIAIQSATISKHVIVHSAGRKGSLLKLVYQNA
jgi:hypothetical protein